MSLLLKTAIRVSKYKCFQGEPQGFDQVKPINLIIGKNNSGKSALIDLIEYTIQPELRKLEPSNGKTQAFVSVPIDEQLIEAVLEDHAGKQGAPKENFRNNINAEFSRDTAPKSIDVWFDDQGMLQYHNDYTFGQCQSSLNIILSGLCTSYQFRRLNAERNIVPEYPDKDKTLAFDGAGATNLVRRILNLRNFDIDIIKKQLLAGINDVINPDILFNDIVIRGENDDNPGGNKWEIFFATEDGWIALSKMGSGVKTIILALLNMIIVPELDHQPRSKYLFALEELENNLHPALQRRLFNYILKYCRESQAIFFITTHSNIAIDTFLHSDIAQVIHVQKKGESSTCTVIKEIKEGKNILKDLDFKASDMLLSNGIIWVEGPSDAIYLELFIDLLKKENSGLSKMNFTIQALATAIWKYAGFSEMNWSRLTENLENQLISLARVNHNHLIILDKDTDYEDKNPDAYESFSHGTGKNKARLISASMKFSDHSVGDLLNNTGDLHNGSLAFWINQGTMETYLEYFVANQGAEFKKYFNRSKNGYFEKKRNGKDHSISKVELAMQIAACCEEHQLCLSDVAPENSPLRNKLIRLMKTIEEWNS